MPIVFVVFDGHLITLPFFLILTLCLLLLLLLLFVLLFILIVGLSPSRSILLFDIARANDAAKQH